MFQWPGVQVVAYVPVAGTGASSDHRRDPAGNCMLDLLRTDEMDVGIQSPSGDDAALARNNLRRGANDHADAILNQRISGMSDPGDATVLDADIGFDDTLDRIKNERVRNDQIQGFRIGGKRRLAHSVANDLSAAKFHLAAVAAILRDEIALDFNEKLRVGQANLVADRRTEHFGIECARQFHERIKAFRSLFR